MAKIRDIMKTRKQASAAHLIAQLNPLIRGWARYHRHVVSKGTFRKVDHLLVKALWRWAKRRHPTKPRRWIRARYFTTIAGDQWVFFAATTKASGKPGKVWLFRAASVPIERHTKTQGAANPYDPAWEVYFEQRLGVKMAANLRGRRSLLFLWKEQHGICPVCDQPITELTGWHNHHIVWRTHGGPDTTANRVLLHPACHRQVHSQGLAVEKPRPATGV